MSYGESSVGGIFANPFDGFNLSGLIYGDGGEFLLDDLGVPAIVGVAFQATFAIITVALISGAIADRSKFSSWLVFAGLWATLAYFPMAHMVWGGGFLSDSENGLAAMLFGTTDGAATVAPIDFAGGTVVHINAGVAALALALIIGKRKGFGEGAFRAHNIPFVMLGAALLWFGWFGFNAGSAFTADGAAGLAWVNTTSATAAAILGWILTEKIRFGHMTALGATSGVVAGLVAITPAAGSVSPFGAIVLGAIAGAVCSLAVSLKTKFGYDDSLDVVGVHLVGGLHRNRSGWPVSQPIPACSTAAVSSSWLSKSRSRWWLSFTLEWLPPSSDLPSRQRWDGASVKRMRNAGSIQQNTVNPHTIS